jgi:DNA polymerase III epsilon subunit-like protein
MRIKPTDRQVVVDLETLSTRPNSCIVSIGAVAFNLQDGILDNFFINVDASSSKSHGLHIDPNTIEWWQKQSKEAQRAWQKDPQSLEYALEKFAEFYEKGNPIWGNGSSFDITILESAYYAVGWDKDKQYGDHLPWKFWDIYDMRTLTSILGRKLEKTGVNHNALDDAMAEAKLLIEMLKS